MSHKATPFELLPLLSELKVELKALYGKYIDKIILFGSYARGDYHPESDIDILVVVQKDDLSGLNQVDNLVNISFNLSLKYDKTISIKATNSGRFALKLPLYQNVKQEGILL